MFRISFNQELDALREGLTGCRLAAYADLSARMVLRVSAEGRPPREEIDALCNLAARYLDGAAITALFEGEPLYSAVFAGTDESRFFVRFRREYMRTIPPAVLCDLAGDVCIMDEHTSSAGAAVANADKGTSIEFGR